MHTAGHTGHLLVPALRARVGGPAVRADRGRHLAGAGFGPAELAAPTRGAVTDGGGGVRWPPRRPSTRGASPLFSGWWRTPRVVHSPVPTRESAGTRIKPGSPVPSPALGAVRDENKRCNDTGVLVTVAPTPTTPRFHDASATLGTRRPPDATTHPLDGNHPRTSDPNDTNSAAPGGRTRRDLPQPRAGLVRRNGGCPAVVTVRHKTGSSADEVGAEFAVQQVHQGFPVLGGRFGWPQVRLGLLDQAEDGGGGVLVDDP
jgi:hypothetical protein